MFIVKKSIQKNTNTKDMIIIPAQVNEGIVIFKERITIKIAIAKKYENVLNTRSEKHFLRKALVGVI